MLTKSLCRVIPVMLLALFMATAAMAVAPNEFVYQGRLADTTGAAIVDPTNVTFSIYSVASGGTAVWSGVILVTPDANGIFTTNIGPLGSGVFTGNVMYLGLKIGADPEMTPRQVLSAAPYSMMAMGVPNNSINDGDIIDEPGISTFGGTGGYTLDDVFGFEDIILDTISIPTSGYITVRAWGMMRFSGSTSSNYSELQIDETAGGSSNYPKSILVGLTAYSGTGLMFIPYYVERVYFKNAGTYVFRLEGDRSSTNGSASSWYHWLVCTFYPSNYGSVVVTSGPSDDEPDLEFNSPPIIMQSADGTQTQEVHQVDLRQLELKATKAELEAEKARNEYLDAKAKAEEQDN